jgi:hypothetical protein
MVNLEPNVIEPLPVASPAYKSNWTAFVRYVNTQLNGPDQLVGQLETKYLTRENVDAFFTAVIPTLLVQPSTAQRYRTALQWYANHWEWTVENAGFIVDSKTVQKSLNKHATKFLLEYSLRNHDAHEGLPTDVLSNADHLKVLQFVAQNNPMTWIDFSVSFTSCHATYIRQDTLRKLFLCHLRADVAHGPPGCSTNNQTILCFILEPGTRKDDSAENRANQPGNAAGRGGGAGRKAPTQYKKRVVGGYRHQHFLQCFTGMMGINLVVRFCDHPNLSFLQDANKSVRPGWQKQPVLPNWRPTETGRTNCSVCYKKIVETDCGIQWNKVTHLRSAAMEQTSAQGLPADQIATMSKHRGERLFDAYLTELFPEVMLVMSGHKPGDTWFVPRTEVEVLPFSLDVCIRKLFRHYDIWCSDLESAQGDKQTSARNFLYTLIPYLTRVVFQDAPYWFKYYPNSEWSRFLSNLLPVHVMTEWCNGAIQQAKEINDSRSINEVETLNNAAR